MQTSTVLLLSCIKILCVISQEITVRRDAEWPPQAFVKTLTEASKVCKGKTGATDEMITRFSDKEVHDHPNLKCYLKCIMLEMKTMDEEGNFDAGPAMELVAKLEKWAQKILLSMGSKCVRLKFPKEIDLCEKAFLLHKCLKEADPVVNQINFDNAILTDPTMKFGVTVTEKCGIWCCFDEKFGVLCPLNPQ